MPRALAPPQSATRGIVQRSTRNVIQCAKLNYSDTNFTTEKATYTAAEDYFYAEVQSWLFTVGKEHGGVAADAASKVLGRLDKTPLTWDVVKHYIDWVNRAIDRVGQQVQVPERMLGVPPSKIGKIGLKYANYDDYVAKKTQKQLGTTHVAIDDDISARLGASKSSGASDVSVKVFVNTAEKWAVPSNTYKNELATPFNAHNHEITESKNDGEVRPLSGALDMFVADFKKATAHNHKIAIVGRYGACDGCKERIRKFKEIWRREKGQLTGTLTVTYFYLEYAAEYDRTKSRYGWREAQASNANGVNHYYWSTVVK